MLDAAFDGTDVSVTEHANKRSKRSRISGKPIGGIAKRGFDIVFSAAALLALSVVFLVISALLYCFGGKGSIFFGHTRIGFNNKSFKCLKFRTMVPDAEEKLEALLKGNHAFAEEFARTHKLKNDPRIIPVIGSFLRKTSLDELPQFFNVLVGQMSVVGPRPVTREEVELYQGSRDMYLSARPGVTGIWQVSGRSSTSFAERVDMDVNYIKNWDFLTDVKVIFKTFSVFAGSKDAV